MNIQNILYSDFCPHSTFEKKIEDILHWYLLNSGFRYDRNMTGILFKSISEVYEDMRIHINIPNVLNLYFTPDGVLKSSLNPSYLTDQTYGIYAGLDLPIWLNDPLTATKRIMVIGQDPRRNDKEMQNTPDCITLSTPFGFHSHSWRLSNKGLIHQVFEDIINNYYQNNGSNLCVYFTDFYKFRKAEGSKSKIDTPNIDVYYDTLSCEICNFQPDLIIPVGCKAASAIMRKKIGWRDCFKRQTIGSYTYFPILHVSGANNGFIRKVKQVGNNNHTFFVGIISRNL